MHVAASQYMAGRRVPNTREVLLPTSFHYSFPNLLFVHASQLDSRQTSVYHTATVPSKEKTIQSKPDSVAQRAVSFSRVQPLVPFTQNPPRPPPPLFPPTFRRL